MAIISPNPDTAEGIVLAVHFASLPVGSSRERIGRFVDELPGAFPDMHRQSALPFSADWEVRFNSHDGASTIQIQNNAFIVSCPGRVAPGLVEFADSIKPAFVNRFGAFSDLVRSKLGAEALHISRCEFTCSLVIEEAVYPSSPFSCGQEIAEDLRLNWQFIAHSNPAIAPPKPQTMASVLEITASGQPAPGANLTPGVWFERAHSAAVNTARKFTKPPKLGGLDAGYWLGLPGGAPPYFDNATLQAYRRRIEELRGYGQADGIAINPDSERDFLAFVQTLPGSRRAGLVLTDDGTLRAAWDNDNDEETHLGVEFLGNGRTVYVIFRRMPEGEELTSIAETADFDGIKRLIADYDLQHLV